MGSQPPADASSGSVDRRSGADQLWEVRPVDGSDVEYTFWLSDSVPQAFIQTEKVEYDSKSRRTIAIQTAYKNT